MLGLSISTMFGHNRLPASARAHRPFHRVGIHVLGLLKLMTIFTANACYHAQFIRYHQ